MLIELVTDGERLKEIRPAWNSLWHRSHGGIFQSHLWISEWWQECRADHSLCIACAWRDDQLVVVLPLCIHRWWGLRVLEWAAQPFSDYCDAMALPSEGPTHSPTLLEMWAAIDKRGRFDLVRLKHVAPHAMITPLLNRVASKERDEICLQVASAWKDGETWFRTLNKKTRNNHARGGRILREFGHVEFRQLTGDEPREPVIRRLLALKRQWKSNRDSPLVRTDTILLALVRALDAMGTLRVFLIEHAGTIIAGSVNAVHDGKMLALFATYDPTYERASPGILLMTEYTKWAFDQRMVEVDYLLGAEPYKFKFANQRTKLHIFVAARTPIGWLALRLNRWIRQSPAEPEIEIGSAYRTAKGTERHAVEQVSSERELTR